MPTENRRVATYLPKEIDDRFKAFIAERELKGDSQALIIILSEFFQVSQEVTHQNSLPNLEFQKRIEVLEEKFDHLTNELLSELRRELLEDHTQSIKQANIEFKNELLSELADDSRIDLQALKGRLEILEALQVTDSTLSTGQLAQRLEIDSSTLSHWKSSGKKGKAPDELLKVTREKDPEGIGWMSIPGTSRFKPERELGSSSDSILQGELLSQKEV